jgi:hypothetical protein
MAALFGIPQEHCLRIGPLLDGTRLRWSNRHCWASARTRERWATAFCPASGPVFARRAGTVHSPPSGCRRGSAQPSSCRSVHWKKRRCGASLAGCLCFIRAFPAFSALSALFTKPRLGYAAALRARSRAETTASGWASLVSFIHIFRSKCLLSVSQRASVLKTDDSDLFTATTSARIESAFPRAAFLGIRGFSDRVFAGTLVIWTAFALFAPSARPTAFRIRSQQI